MQAYTRQIAYLYAYEYGIKKRSVGFVKYEIRGTECRMDICLKSDDGLDDEPAKGYIYFSYENRMIGIAIGDFKRRNHVLEWKGSFDPENILGKGIRMIDTKGIWVRRTGQREYIAEWDDASVDVQRFLLYPAGGIKCIRCPRLEECERNSRHASDRR
ncbi:MAG: hypothetical protein IKV59_06905 [Lachnospiraceae bacterium]|nr:hypothetical protein [Lachnospiraceae bacterium]